MLTLPEPIGPHLSLVSLVCMKYIYIYIYMYKLLNGKWFAINYFVRPIQGERSK